MLVLCVEKRTGRSGFSAERVTCARDELCAKLKKINLSSDDEIINLGKKCLSYCTKKSANKTLSTSVDVAFESMGYECSFQVLLDCPA